MDGATLRLFRRSTYRDRVRAYKVILDGEKIGDIRNGEEETFPIAPGRHVLKLKIDWAGSPEMTFDVATGETASFECGGDWSRTTMTDMFFRPQSYIALRPATGDEVETP